MTIRTQYPYQTLNIVRGGADEPAFDLWVVYVPYDKEQRSHISCGMLMIEKPPIPGLIHALWPLIRRFAESVFTEDRMAVEAEQKAHDEQQGDWNQNQSSDHRAARRADPPRSGARAGNSARGGCGGISGDAECVTVHFMPAQIMRLQLRRLA